jgi:PAS domain S-box-containing protein
MSATPQFAEEKRADGPWCESEANFRQVAENSEDVFWIVDETEHDASDGEHRRWLYVSPAYELIWGRSREALRQDPQSFLATIFPDDRAIVKNYIRQQRLGNAQAEYRIVRPDSSVRWICDHSFPIRNQPGKSHRVAGIARDITDHKENEERLRSRQSQLEKAQELAHLGSWIWEVQTDEITWSEELCRISGRSPGEAPRNYPEFLEIVHPDDRPILKQAIVRTLNGNEPYDIEQRLIRPDGSVCIVRIRGLCVRDSGGAAVRMHGVVVDITEAKKAEQLLRERANLLNLAHDAIVVRNFEDKKITFWNKGAEHLYGWTAAEAIGRKIPELIYRDPEALEPLLETLLITGQCHGEIREAGKDGKEAIVDARGTLLRDEHGAPQSVLSFGTDITDRKRAEAVLHELPALVLKAQDDERRRIARELHDSTLQDLVVVAINLGQLERGVKGRDRSSENLIADSLAVLAKAIRDLRTIAHLLHPPTLEEFGLAGALRDYLRGFSERSGIKVEFDCPAEVDRCSHEVETALFRVAQESLANVHHHSRSESAVVRLALISGNMDLTIIDRGYGLPTGLLEGKNSRFRIGVGISGMRQRMHQLGGALEIISSAEGTTVHAALPCHPDVAGLDPQPHL